MFVDKNGDAAIGDFGTSRREGSSWGFMGSSSRGTTRFLAPELLDELNMSSTQTDVWAWACTYVQVCSHPSVNKQAIHTKTNTLT